MAKHNEPEPKAKALPTREQEQQLLRTLVERYGLTEILRDHCRPTSDTTLGEYLCALEDAGLFAYAVDRPLAEVLEAVSMETQRMASEELERRIILAVDQADDPLGIAEIRQQVGEHGRHVSTAAQRLAADGRLRIIGNRKTARYATTEEE